MGRMVTSILVLALLSLLGSAVSNTTVLDILKPFTRDPNSNITALPPFFPGPANRTDWPFPTQPTQDPRDTTPTPVYSPPTVSSWRPPSTTPFIFVSTTEWTIETPPSPSNNLPFDWPFTGPPFTLESTTSTSFTFTWPSFTTGTHPDSKSPSSTTNTITSSTTPSESSSKTTSTIPSSYTPSDGPSDTTSTISSSFTPSDGPSDTTSTISSSYTPSDGPSDTNSTISSSYTPSDGPSDTTSTIPSSYNPSDGPSDTTSTIPSSFTPSDGPSDTTLTISSSTISTKASSITTVTSPRTTVEWSDYTETTIDPGWSELPTPPQSRLWPSAYDFSWPGNAWLALQGYLWPSEELDHGTRTFLGFDFKTEATTDCPIYPQLYI